MDDTETDDTETTLEAEGVEETGEEQVETEADATEVDATEADAADGSSSAAPEAKRGWRQTLTRLWFPLALVVALIASAALAGWLYFAQFRVDQQTGEAASATVLKAASDGTVALLTYAPDSLDRDFSAAKSHLTGDFLSYYTQFTQEIVAPAAKQKSVKTTAAVVRSAVSEIHPDSAVVLVFVNQATTSSENPNGSFAASAVKVGMSKIDGNWLISSFDPV
ncbi:MULTISPECIES: twin-arginine translocation pathway signal [unclassified Mycolicibacterium]|uniref:twin-arginine translocation pathway signal n=1 Tax=unclassified Mycolicibacterium TaxID=2636767 RepID=UPI0012DC8B1A|nr:MULTISPECIES: twin-arginine translocation pathway signal [unclassified Mycolicibacterium]MUL83434.1 twin-arginine translocation pathway signal [Mycolicibacterium sp. CBMA 329]MUL90425.1 twin-arginine translocation pathway signal [Mycolicibacterium sp. CBMA 331]MUM00398.1 twin-arginine translocation pathway signal [Mycolicibacterium sp. CBMA 334]MUM30017.1 twin-arginine translocation pathway signal [Mycolicibacterium sp. CBMA 295]MUM41369.1 twin-arginine translocation pathway signal [Mycolic